MRRIFLASNSTLHGHGYLDHCADALREFLGAGVRRVLFVPYALHARDAYAAKVGERFARMGLEIESVHRAADPAAAVRAAQAVFVGGGNTFRLLRELYAQGLVEALRARVHQDLPYIGSSAGSNVACASIKTTNDMPIVLPPTFDALALVPFNLNPHYQDPIQGSTHMGETREQRIGEFHEENAQPVVGLREGAWLRVEGTTLELCGTTGARLFQRGTPAREIASGARLDFLLD